MNGNADPPLTRGLIEHHYAELPGGRPARIQLHVVTAGPEDGPVVVLLHGFPEAWFSWQHQIRALAQAGYRVVAPDQRGYNLSDKPKGVSSYRIERLTGDIAALIHWAGAEQATVVGHDWGANVAWNFAMRHPEMLDRLVTMNVPHPATMKKAFSNPAQLLRSSYAFAFQFPRLPERMFLARDVAVLRKTLQVDPVREGAFTEGDIARYVEAMKRPGAVSGGMNYYRAAFRQAVEQTIRVAPVTAPVLVIWGERDRYIGRQYADPPPNLAPNARVVRIPNASHWVQNDRPERVNELLLAFLRQA
jgi:pimeloyl-ACP methyl ester carboxylesterase